MASRELDNRRLGPVLSGLAGLAGLSLVVLGSAALFVPREAAVLYGIPADGAAAATYMTAAAVRDIAAGALVVAFALLRDRRAVGVSLALGTVIPIGDGAIALLRSPTPWRCVPIHWGSAVVCVIFAAVVLARRSGRAPLL